MGNMSCGRRLLAPQLTKCGTRRESLHPIHMKTGYLFRSALLPAREDQARYRAFRSGDVHVLHPHPGISQGRW